MNTIAHFRMRYGLLLFLGLSEGLRSVKFAASEETLQESSIMWKRWVILKLFPALPLFRAILVNARKLKAR